MLAFFIVAVGVSTIQVPATHAQTIGPTVLPTGAWGVAVGTETMPELVESKVGAEVVIVRPRSVQEIICSYPWPCQKALSVAECESHYDPRAYANHNLGVFQVNEVHAAMVNGNLDSLYDPEINTRIAYQLWQSQGWGPWVHCGGG